VTNHHQEFPHIPEHDDPLEFPGEHPDLSRMAQGMASSEMKSQSGHLSWVIFPSLIVYIYQRWRLGRSVPSS